MERSILMKTASDALEQVKVEVCGFGPIASAARVSQVLSQSQYDHVILTGIAGAYREHDLRVGNAYLFHQVTCHGIGVGEGKSHLSSDELDWNQVEPSTGTGETGMITAVKSHLELLVDDHLFRETPLDDHSKHLALLSCCSASANPTEAAERSMRYPHASAEDMEGFGVAVACHLHQTPLCIVRGISNEVGNRDHQQWQVEQAMEAAAKLTMKLLAQSERVPRGQSCENEK